MLRENFVHRIREERVYQDSVVWHVGESVLWNIEKNISPLLHPVGLAVPPVPGSSYFIHWALSMRGRKKSQSASFISGWITDGHFNRDKVNWFLNWPAAPSEKKCTVCMFIPDLDACETCSLFNRVAQFLTLESFWRWRSIFLLQFNVNSSWWYRIVMLRDQIPVIIHYIRPSYRVLPHWSWKRDPILAAQVLMTFNTNTEILKNQLFMKSIYRHLLFSFHDCSAESLTNQYHRRLIW